MLPLPPKPPPPPPLTLLLLFSFCSTERCGIKHASHWRQTKTWLFIGINCRLFGTTCFLYYTILLHEFYIIYSCKWMDSRIFFSILFEFLSDIVLFLEPPCMPMPPPLLLPLSSPLLPFQFWRREFEPAPKNSAKLHFFFVLFFFLFASFSSRLTDLNRFESIKTTIFFDFALYNCLSKFDG